MRKLLDWVPTIPEIFEYASCRLAGHDWITVISSNSAKGITICETCGKEKDSD